MSEAHAPSAPDLADLATFTRQLGAMLDAGVDVLRALRIASQHVGTERIMHAADDIARGMKDGRELHQAAARHPELFDPFYVEMARQGEADGILGKALLAVADYLDRSGGVFSHGDTPTAPADSVAPTATTLAACGAGALGVAAVWSLVGSGKVSGRWLGPLATAWAGACLAGGAWALRKTQPGSGAASAVPTLPPKSAARRVAETHGIVRSALQEQSEHEQERGTPLEAPERESAGPDFEAGGVRGELDPDPSLHRFEL